MALEIKEDPKKKLPASQTVDDEKKAESIATSKDSIWSQYQAKMPKIQKHGEIRAMDLAIQAIEFILETEKIARLGIADLGCGDASIAQHFYTKEQLSNFDDKNKIIKYKQCNQFFIDSIDLHSVQNKDAKYITHFDFCKLDKLGIKNDYYDIIICCLSMQSKIDVKLKQIERVLNKKTGHLLIWHPQSQQESIMDGLKNSNFKILHNSTFARFGKNSKSALHNVKSMNYLQIFCNYNVHN